jgi:hypothetical protein
LEALAGGEPATSGLPLPDPELGHVAGELQALLALFYGSRLGCAAGKRHLQGGVQLARLDGFD